VSTFTIAAVQASPVFLDRDATIAKARELIAEAGRSGARLIVFPEAFIPTYPDWVWRIPPGQHRMLADTYAELIEQSVEIPGPLNEEEGIIYAEVEPRQMRGPEWNLDVAGHYARPDVIDDLADSLGGVDVLVNNASTGDPTDAFLELPYEEWRQVIVTNLSGTFLCAQRAARRMVEAGNGGRIINITSVHEHIPRTGASAYCSSKGGLGLLTKVMAMELAEYGILVNAVGSGEISTPMTSAEDEDPTTIERPKLPLGRPGHAREISAWVAFLASEKSSYATGASIVVDGGLTLMAAELSS
jgi:NAD(P)-dependent dehydrogenase (short-subunit alcohol dehydrogenase family)